MSEFEVWYHPGRDSVKTVERNLCGCCPASYIMYWGIRWVQSGAFVFESRQKFLSYMRSYGWVKL